MPLVAFLLNAVRFNDVPPIMAHENSNATLPSMSPGNCSAHSSMAICICTAFWSFTLCMEESVFSQTQGAPSMQISEILSPRISTFPSCLTNPSCQVSASLSCFCWPQWNLQLLPEAPSVQCSLESTPEYKSEMITVTTWFISPQRATILSQLFSNVWNQSFHAFGAAS